MSAPVAPEHGLAPLAPGPKGRFLVGVLPEIAPPITRTQVVSRWQREYGDVIHMQLGPRSSHIVLSPEGVKHFLHDRQANYPKSSSYDEVRAFLGNGLLTSEGDFWRRQRRMMQPHFHMKAIARLADEIAETTAAMRDRWRPGETIDVANEMMRLTLRVVAKTLLGVESGSAADVVGWALPIALEITARRSITPFKLPRNWPTPENRRFAAALKALDREVYEVIAHRRANPGGRQDLLAMLLASRDEDTGEGMSDAQLRDEVMTIFLAGHETTANALTWAFYLLSRHPEVERRLHAEVSGVLGDRLPTFEDLGRLTYTGMVLDEAMRLYPPIPFIERTALADDVIGGYRIPAGANVGVNVFVLHRHTEHWENPEGFDPERFTPERTAARHRFAYLPFGGGARVCIGNNFALMEAKLVLAMIVQRFQLNLQSGHPVVPEPVLTLRPQHGMPMIVKAR